MLRDRDEAVFRCVHRLDKTRAASLGINKFLRVEQRSEEHPTFPPHPFLPTQAVSANLFVDTVEPSHPDQTTFSEPDGTSRPDFIAAWWSIRVPVNMAPENVNLLLSSFPGLGFPSTLSIPVPTSALVSEIWITIDQRLPNLNHRLILSTNSNKQLSRTSSKPITSLLSSPDDEFLPLRLSVPLCGGKGGFGSQLRAAGGRMSSRKKRQQGEVNGSSRNLDGRRLRTVNEAKALAEYLAVKPEMDKKEKEERRKRWELIVEMAEKKTDEIKNGTKARLDSKFFEERDEASEKTKQAVLAALDAGDIKEALGMRESDESAEDSEDTSDSESDDVPTEGPSEKKEVKAAQSKTFFGWDEDEDMSDDDEEDDEDEDEDEVPSEAEANTKGKAKA